MPVSSYAIRCESAYRADVIARLTELPGVTVGEATANGIPVITETKDTHSARELGEKLEQVPGVASAVLIYHNFEDES